MIIIIVFIISIVIIFIFIIIIILIISIMSYYFYYYHYYHYFLLLSPLLALLLLVLFLLPVIIITVYFIVIVIFIHIYFSQFSLKRTTCPSPICTGELPPVSCQVNSINRNQARLFLSWPPMEIPKCLACQSMEMCGDFRRGVCSRRGCLGHRHLQFRCWILNI